MNKALTIFLSASMLCLSVAAESGAVGQQKVRRAPDQLTLLYLLQNKLYAQLNEKLDAYQKAFERDVTEERSTELAFDAFDNALTELGPPLNEWVQKFSNSYVPFAARARWYAGMAWDARGTRWASETTEDQFAGMQKFLRLAVKDAADAIALNPKLMNAYEVMIRAGMAVSDTALTGNAMRRALAVNPYSLEVRASYIWSLLPRWGGSYEQMSAFAAESERFATGNPSLKVLKGFIPYDKGLVVSRDEKYREAIKYFDEAIRFGPRASFYESRGDAYQNVREYARALKDYGRSLEQNPSDKNVLKKEAELLLYLGRPDEAQAALSLVDQLESLSPRVEATRNREALRERMGTAHALKGYQLIQQKQPKEAIDELTLALEENSDDPTTYYNRGIAYRDLGQLDDALADFRKTVALNRNYVSAYDNMANIFYQRAQYADEVTVWNAVIAIEPQSGKAFFYRALALARQEKFREALPDAQKACNLGYPNACSLYEDLKKHQ